MASTLFTFTFTPGMPGTASHARAMNRRYHTASAPRLPRHTVPVVEGGSERATCKGIRSGISASALICRGLRQPSQGLHGRPRATPHHQRPRWVADLRNPSAREHLWHPAIRSVYTSAPSAVVHLIMSLRSSHLVGDHLFYLGTTAVASTCRICQDRVSASRPKFGSAPRARAIREHRFTGAYAPPGRPLQGVFWI